MNTKKSGALPNKRRKYDAPFRAKALHLPPQSRRRQVTARQLDISPKLPYRWQQRQLVVEVGSVEVVRNPEVRQLRA